VKNFLIPLNGNFSMRVGVQNVKAMPTGPEKGLKPAKVVKLNYPPQPTPTDPLRCEAGVNLNAP